MPVAITLWFSRDPATKLACQAECRTSVSQHGTLRTTLPDISLRANRRPARLPVSSAAKRMPTPTMPRRARASFFLRIPPARGRRLGCAADRLSARSPLVRHLILLRHKFFCAGSIVRAQHGHRDKRQTMAAVSLRRRVAIEFGMWRSVLSGGAAGSIIFGKARRLEVRGGTRF
jgi:hypothetical protein